MGIIEITCLQRLQFIATLSWKNMCSNGENCILAFLSYRAVVCKWGCTFWRVIRNKNKNRWLGSTPRDSDLIGLGISRALQECLMWSQHCLWRLRAKGQQVLLWLLAWMWDTCLLRNGAEAAIHSVQSTKSHSAVNGFFAALTYTEFKPAMTFVFHCL